MPVSEVGRGANRRGNKILRCFNRFKQIFPQRQIRRNRRRQRAACSVRRRRFDEFRFKNMQGVADDQIINRERAERKVRAV